MINNYLCPEGHQTEFLIWCSPQQRTNDYSFLDQICIVTEGIIQTENFQLPYNNEILLFKLHKYI